MNLEAVTKLFDHYHDAVKTNPTLYTSKGMVQVVLPKSLREYCNAAAGHANRIPVGIRRSTTNPKQEIAGIFRSVDSLTKFLLESECDYEACYGGIVIERRTKVKSEVVQIARKDFWTKYTRTHLESLKTKFGYSTILAAMNSMTLSQFENEFGLI